MKQISHFLLLIFSTIHLFAQSGDLNWVLGNQNIISFATKPPTVFRNANFYSTSCLASYSNTSGKILYKTNGDTLWNEYNEIVQYGEGLAGHGQGSAIICRSPVDSNIFILILSDVLAVNNFTGYKGRGITYSIIDRSKNGGHSSVILKNKMISNYTAGNFGVIYSADSTKLWLAINFNEIDSLYIYSISNNQITTTPNKQVVSKLNKVEDFSYNIRSKVRFSPDAKFLIAYSNNNPLEIFNFDLESGKLKNKRILKCNMGWAAEFSPNSKILYLKNNKSKLLSLDSLNVKIGFLQLDLTQLKDTVFYTNYPSILEIGLKYLNYVGEFRLGPDDNVYFSGYYFDTTEFLGQIKFPNEVFPNCGIDTLNIKLNNENLNVIQYVKNSYYFNKFGNSLNYSPLAYNLYGYFKSGFLPDFPITKKPEFKIQTSLACQNQSVAFNLVSGYNCKVHWDFGDGTGLETGGMSAFHKYASSGTFRVQAFIEHSQGKDTVTSSIWVHPLTQLDLPKDTLLCTSDTLNIQLALAANETCFWSDSSKSKSHKINTEGEYWVRVSSPYCAQTDTIIVKTVNCNLHPQQFCLLDSLQLNLLNSGADSAQIQATVLDTTVLLPTVFSCLNIRTGADTLRVTYYKQGLKNHNELVVHILKPIEIFSFTDTAMCSNQPLSINYNPVEFSNFKWEDGIFSSPRLITQEGAYKVLAYDSNHCQSKDSFWVYHYDCTLDFNDACQDSAVLFKTGVNATAKDILYFGNGDSIVDPSQIISYRYGVSGTYQVTKTIVHSKGQLTASKSLTVEKNPKFRLTSDTTICRFSELSPTIYIPARTYQWLGQPAGSTVKIIKSGTYTLIASNGSCVQTDSVVVNVLDCDCPVWAADVFTPNSDGLNDVFLPQFGCKITEMRLRIFNRWGELIFETTNPDQGWTAKIRNNEVVEGVFIWTLDYRAADTGLNYRKSGNVTLLK